MLKEIATHSFSYNILDLRFRKKHWCFKEEDPELSKRENAIENLEEDTKIVNLSCIDWWTLRISREDWQQKTKSESLYRKLTDCSDPGDGVYI